MKMCSISDDWKHFNIWLLEGIACQLTQQFLSLTESRQQNSSVSMLRLISAWTSLSAWFPDRKIDSKLMHWNIICDLIIHSYSWDNIDRLHILINELGNQKKQLKIIDCVYLQVLQFLHTMITMHHYTEQDFLKARDHITKNKVLHADVFSDLLNQNGSEEIPEELELQNLQMYILPYIETVMKSLGKHVLFDAISVVESESVHKKVLVDRIISNFNNAGRTANVITSDFDLNCNEVSCSSMESEDRSTCVLELVDTTYAISGLEQRHITPSDATDLITSTIDHTAQIEEKQESCHVNKTSNSPFNSIGHTQLGIEIQDAVCLSSTPDTGGGNTHTVTRSLYKNLKRRKLLIGKPLFTVSHSTEKKPFGRNLLFNKPIAHQNHNASEGNESESLSTLATSHNRSLHKTLKLKDERGYRSSSVEKRNKFNEDIWTLDDDNDENDVQPELSLEKRKVKVGKGSKRLKFTLEEEKYVIQGVKMYGYGNWKSILKGYPFHESRTNVSIKDKYRTMVKNELI